MSPLPVKITIPAQSLKKYLQVYAPDSAQSPDDWSAEETTRVKVGDIYTFFRPSRVLTSWSELSELEVAGVALVFREDAGFPMNYYVEDSAYEMSFIEGVFSTKASEAKEKQQALYFLHSSLSKALVGDSATALGGMHKWGGAGERSKAPQGLADPLYYFLTSLGLSIDASLAKDPLPVSEFVLSLWNPTALPAGTKAIAVDTAFSAVEGTPLNLTDSSGSEAAPTNQAASAGAANPAAPAAEPEKTDINFGSFSLSSLLDDWSTPGAGAANPFDAPASNNLTAPSSDALLKSPAASDAVTVPEKPASAAAEGGSLSALLERMATVPVPSASAEAPVSAPAGPAPALESPAEEEENLDFASLGSALKGLVSTPSAKPAEKPAEKRGPVGPQFKDSDDAWAMLKAKPGSAPEPAPAQKAAAPDSAMDLSAMLAAELNSEVSLSLPAAEPKKAQGMEPWPADFAAAMKEELAAPVAAAKPAPNPAAPAKASVPEEGMDLSSMLAAELNAEVSLFGAEPSVAPKAASTAPLPQEGSDLSAMLAAELNAEVSLFGSEPAAAPAAVEEGKDLSAMLAAELNAEVSLFGSEP
ncbi:MAG: hypothetical protein K2X27_05115, partial [Candidatus Obscuribacterales bacterium]|nr:hypothetical protein [Candidatus Obscuribacterales bacterium]